MIRNNIKDLARDLLKTSSVLEGELEDIIDGIIDPELDPLMTVLNVIIDQNYDMAGFAIDNVTENGMYSFYDGADRYFDIRVVKNNAVISYPEPISQGSTSSKEVVVDTIVAAVMNASVWLENCKLSLR